MKTLASLVPMSAPSLPKTSEILVLFCLMEAVHKDFLYNLKGSLPFEISSHDLVALTNNKGFFVRVFLGEVRGG